MKKVIAKMQNGGFCIIFSHDTHPGLLNMESLYTLPDFLTNAIPFDPDRTLTDEERFYIQPNAEQKATLIAPYFNAMEDIIEINPITEEDYRDVRAICLVERDENEWNLIESMIITRVYPRFYRLQEHRFTRHNWPSLSTNTWWIYFTAQIDAYRNGTRLYFKSYWNIKPIFQWLEDFYRLATDQEKELFLAQPFFLCNNPNIEVKERNLRKIPDLLWRINFDDLETRISYINYARAFPDVWVNLSEEPTRFIIENNQDLTRVLSILEERIYKTPITNQIKEANSTVVIGPDL